MSDKDSVLLTSVNRANMKLETSTLLPPKYQRYIDLGLGWELLQLLDRHVNPGLRTYLQPNVRRFS